MTLHRLARSVLFGCAIIGLAACGGGGGLFGGSGLFGSKQAKFKAPEDGGITVTGKEAYYQRGNNKTTLRDLFGKGDNPNTTLEVNRYLWAASLEVLNFLPIETVDPFSGVIVTGYGTPPGGGRAYRATILVNDPALDARSLKLSLQSKGGAVDPATVRAVEDAILTRARQLRAQDAKL